MSTPTLEVSLVYRVYRAARVLRQDFLRVAAEAGLQLTPEQWFVLNKLRHRDGPTQAELSEALLSDRPNMSRIVAGLEARGWVARRRSREDGRAKRVHITQAGIDTHDAFAGLVDGERQRLFGDLDPAAVATTLGVLDHLERIAAQPTDRVAHATGEEPCP